MSSIALGEHLAALNASLNALAALLITGGWLAIRARRPRLHSKFMATAFGVSALFLCSYLTRVYVSGTHRYPGSGAWRTAYLVILISHMLLAVITPPLVIRTIFLATKKRFSEHTRIVRYTLPVWMYVSVTGVVVYLMLYHPPG